MIDFGGIVLRLTLVVAFLVVTAGSAVAAGSRAGAGLKLATWNLEWLMSPATYDALAPRCLPHQPASGQRALPCAADRPPVPRRDAADFAALARYARRLDADVVALQEVDGAGAARRVFGGGYAYACFTRRAHPQKVGFAVRRGLPFRCNAELRALDIDGSSRGGADLTLFPGRPREIRLLAVHLKSGCFARRLDDDHPPCAGLQRQVPVLEAWVEARLREGRRFAIVGDFNRQLEVDARYPAGADEARPLNLIAALADGVPRGARLVRSTEGAPFIPCSAGDHYDRYIDAVLLGPTLAADGWDFLRQPYADADAQRFTLSDHCPTGVVLRTPSAKARARPPAQP